jgi:hypothetical protein
VDTRVVGHDKLRLEVEVRRVGLPSWKLLAETINTGMRHPHRFLERFFKRPPDSHHLDYLSKKLSKIMRGY